MNETNRTVIVLFAALWIVLMAVVAFLTWAAPGDVIEQLQDFVGKLDENNDTAGRMIVTLGALALAVLALLVIVIELAPEDEERELRVEQAGSTTIVPVRALRGRLEEALVALPDVRGARARLSTRDKGIAARLELSVKESANIAAITQDSSRIIVDTIQTELGLPMSGLPVVRIGFGGPEPGQTAATQVYPTESAASSVAQAPQELVATDPGEMIGTADDAPPLEPAVLDPLEGPTQKESSSDAPVEADEQGEHPRW